jgi:hypothetical protein
VIASGLQFIQTLSPFPELVTDDIRLNSQEQDAGARF